MLLSKLAGRWGISSILNFYYQASEALNTSERATQYHVRDSHLIVATTQYLKSGWLLAA